MNIGIDASSLVYGRGVSRYTRNLITALSQKPEIELSLYGYSLRRSRQLKSELRKIVKNSRHQLQVQTIPPKLQSLLWSLGLNKVKKNFSQINLFHSWDWLQPPDKNLPLVSTIHDLAILKYPKTAHPRVVKAHQKSWKVLKDRQAHIIAVSQATKQDVIDLLDFPSYRVHVIPEALPQEIRQVSEQLTEDKYEFIKQQLDLAKPYLLFVGTREPRKNLKKIIKAWQPLAADYQLLVVGESGWDQLDNKALNQPNLRFLGRVSDEKLNVLYAEAELFVYASLYEGFGLPILEAFYHGTPVVTSNISAMIEVAGNAAELVDPESAVSIRNGIFSILNESEAEQRKRLQRMIIRLQMFDWDKVADQTIKVYRQALNDFQD